jgi:hypothetical protein
MITPFWLLWDESRERREHSGSSGKPKMQLVGQTGSTRTVADRRAAGRNPGYVSDRASRVQAVVKSKFVLNTQDARRHIVQHVFYIAERNQQEWEHRRFFTNKRMDVPRDEVIKYMTAHQGREVSMHKIILSPGDNSVNLVHYTRESMKELEQTLGYKIDWFAVEHTNTDHYHVHVVIPGKIPEQDRQRTDTDRDIEKYLATWANHMEGRDLKLYRYNLDTLREAGNDFLLRERSIDRALDLAIEKELGLDNWTYDVSVYQKLGLQIWHQNKEYERELGLTSAEQDRALRSELGIKQDRSALKELGLGRFYELGRPFTHDQSAEHLYELGSEREQFPRDVGPFDPLASQMYRDGDGTSDERELEQRPPLETNLPQLMLGLQSQRERDASERDHVQDGFANALYEHQNPREQSASVADFEMQLLYQQHKEDQDKERDDDERFKGGTQ